MRPCAARASPVAWLLACDLHCPCPCPLLSSLLCGNSVLRAWAYALTHPYVCSNVRLAGGSLCFVCHFPAHPTRSLTFWRSRIRRSCVGGVWKFSLESLMLIPKMASCAPCEKSATLGGTSVLSLSFVAADSLAHVLSPHARRVVVSETSGSPSSPACLVSVIPNHGTRFLVLLLRLCGPPTGCSLVAAPSCVRFCLSRETFRKDRFVFECMRYLFAICETQPHVGVYVSRLPPPDPVCRSN